MTNNKIIRIKRVFSAIIAVAITVAAAFTSVSASAEEIAVGLSGGVIDDNDGKFYSNEANGAVSAEWDGTVATAYAGGSGTEADPYQIANGQQLALLAQQVDAGTDYSGLYFKLTADILLCDVNVRQNAWTPIGGAYNYTLKYFNGTFDGANHKVIGMYIYDSSNMLYSGLFGLVGPSGTVKNVGVTDGRMTCPGSYVGGICGVNDGTISNCYNTIRISTGYSYSGYSYRGLYGGVCGINSGTIENCYNNGELEISGRREYIGGVCGYNDTNGIISGCYNTGRVYTSSFSHNVGGVCGYNNAGTIKDSYNTGEVNGYDYTGGVCGYNSKGIVKDSYNTGEVTGRYNYTGGVCGYSDSSNTTDVILRCNNTGNVYGKYDGTGGICGRLSGCLRLCYNKGTVEANDDNIGGICGYVNTGDIKECYNNGAVTMIGSYGEVGGIVGYLSINCIIENCYNTGAIKGGRMVGGVWGCSADSSNTITNCYNIGSVSGSTDVYPVGVDCGQISNVYYDSNLCTGTFSGNSEWAKTTAQLTAANAITALGFSKDVWEKKTNTSNCAYYPDLIAFSDDSPCCNPVPEITSAVSGNGEVTLTWNKTYGATKYAVYSYVGGKYTTETMSATTNFYTVTGLANGTKYGFKVKAYVNGKWSAASAMVYATPAGNTIPENLRIANGDGKVQVTWDKISGATKYAVYSYLDGKYTTQTTAATSNTYTVTGLTNGTKYGFKVKAYVGGKWSAASAIIYARPSASTAPGAIKAIAGSKSAQVKWSGVIGATRYAVYKYENGVYTCINSNIKDNTYTVTGLTAGTKYGFKVKAYVDGKWSAASVIAYATPTA